MADQRSRLYRNRNMDQSQESQGYDERYSEPGNANSVYKPLYHYRNTRDNPPEPEQEKKKRKMSDSPKVQQNWEIYSYDNQKASVVKETIYCRTVAWIVFRQIKDTVDAICRICGSRKRARLGNTTNLLHHINNQHYDFRRTLDSKMSVKQVFPNNIVNLCENITITLKNNNVEIYEKNKNGQNYMQPKMISIPPRIIEYDKHKNPPKPRLEQQQRRNKSSVSFSYQENLGTIRNQDKKNERIKKPEQQKYHEEKKPPIYEDHSSHLFRRKDMVRQQPLKANQYNQAYNSIRKIATLTPYQQQQLELEQDVYNKLNQQSQIEPPLQKRGRKRNEDNKRRIRKNRQRASKIQIVKKMDPINEYQTEYDAENYIEGKYQSFNHQIPEKFNNDRQEQYFTENNRYHGSYEQLNIPQYSNKIESKRFGQSYNSINYNNNNSGGLGWNYNQISHKKVSNQHQTRQVNNQNIQNNIKIEDNQGATTNNQEDIGRNYQEIQIPKINDNLINYENSNQQNIKPQNHDQQKSLSQNWRGIGNISKDLYEDICNEDSEDQDQRTLTDLKKNPDIQIIQVFKNGELTSLIFITQKMKNNCSKYSDSISFWHYARPTFLNYLESVLYICGQNQSASPILFGLAIVFIGIKKTYQTIFHTFNERFHLNGKIWPEKTIICGPISLERYYKQFCQSCSQNTIKEKSNISFFDILKKSQNTTSYVYLKQSILSQITQKARSFVLARAIVTQVQSKSNRNFIGFFITPTFVEKLSNLTPLGFGKQINLTTLLSKIFEEDNTFQKYQNNSLFSKNIKMFNKFQIEKLEKTPLVVECEKMVQKQIFMKLCYSFLYSQFSLHIMSESICPFTKAIQIQIHEINRESPYNYKNTTNKIRFYQRTQQWRCQCGLRQWTDLPCPHLIKILTKKNISFSKYIGIRWLIHQRNHNLNSENNFSIQNEKYVKNTISNQIEDLTVRNNSVEKRRSEKEILKAQISEGQEFEKIDDKSNQIKNKETTLNTPSIIGYEEDQQQIHIQNNKQSNNIQDKENQENIIKSNSSTKKQKNKNKKLNFLNEDFDLCEIDYEFLGAITYEQFLQIFWS